MSHELDFIIMGAMKCATSTLHEQLAAQPGIFMTEPKEPCFFSDDPVYAQGLSWYESLFKDAAEDDLCGESSTHYTKKMTYPKTVERLVAYKQDLKLIYIVRDPIDRLISQYVHEWTQQLTSSPIDDAVQTMPELIDYSLYAAQLTPFLKTFDSGQILLVSFDRLINTPQDELERVCKFIGYPQHPTWQETMDAQNVSSQRIRKSPMRDTIVYAPGVSQIRHKLVPQSVRDRIKSFWRLQAKPILSDATRDNLKTIFNRDLKLLGQWVGLDLNCDNFKSQTTNQLLEWTSQTALVNSSNQNATQRCGAVVIGRNEKPRLQHCIESLQTHADQIVYVDSGSTDGSIELAQSMNVDVVALDIDRPFTAARARNAGLERLIELDGDLTYVQFVDGDCTIADGWIPAAIEQLNNDSQLTVVCGRRREQYPTATIYHRLIDMEWNSPIGFAKACGGDSLMRIETLEQVGRFNPTLICGEEPELCLRMRQAGWRIERMDHDMTWHDAAMTRFSQWWRRSIRSGWAFAEGAALYGQTPERYNVKQSRSIIIWSLILPLIAIGCAWPSDGWSLLLLGLYPLLTWRIARSRYKHGDTKRDAWLYAVFCVIGKWPQQIGMIRYKLHRKRGGNASLIEYKTPPVARCES